MVTLGVLGYPWCPRVIIGNLLDLTNKKKTALYLFLCIRCVLVFIRIETVEFNI